MSHEIRADFNQQFLLPPSLEDWVPQDHAVRFLRDFVRQLDLKALGFSERETEQGRPNYSSELLLSVWLYGYMERIRTSRKLEHACRTHLPLIWLTGMHYPDHNSLWRFWRAHRKAMAAVFRQSVLVAHRLGLVGMVLHALDGTKVSAQSASRKALHRDDLEALKAAIEEAIARMESALEAQTADTGTGAALPEELKQSQQRREAIQQALAVLDAQGENHALPQEPQARLMRQPDGRTDWSYNAQAVVDAAAGIVVAQAVTNEATDYTQLVPLLEQVNETTGPAQTTVADAGYRNAAQQVQAQEAGHDVLLPEHGREADDGTAFHKARFTYDAAADAYTCPQGQLLPYDKTFPKRGVKPAVRVYRCHECHQCPLRDQCTKSSRGRTIRRDEHEAFREGQRERRRQSQAQALLRRRKALIEPLFGHLKENHHFRRWTAKGLENAQAQWAMLCLAVNLKKLCRNWRPDPSPLQA